MKCRKCNKKATIHQNKEDYCRNCFIKTIEKRIRKDARLNQYFKKDQRILVRSPLAEKVVKDITKKFPVKILKKNIKAGIIIKETTMDDEIHSFLDTFMKNKINKTKLKENKKEIKLFRTLTDSEYNTYAKLLGFKQKKRKKDNIDKTIESLEKRYPQIRYSIFQSLKKLREIIR